jgi:hypothetical protein
MSRAMATRLGKLEARRSPEAFSALSDEEIEMALAMVR